MTAAIKPLALCCALFGAGLANAATIFTTGNFAEVFNSTDYYDGNGTYGNLDVQRSSIVGLQQFDPALGTLTGVILSTNFNVSVYGEVQAGPSIDPSTDHGVGFYATDDYGNDGVSVVVSFNNTPSSALSLAFAETNLNPSCTGNENLDGETCTGSDGAAYIFGDESQIVGNTLDKIGLANLLGTGVLAGLSVGSFQPDGSSIFDVLNLEPEESYGFIQTTINAGTVTLTYEYTPTAVPAPAAIWLLASGVAGLFGFANRKRA